MPERFFDREAGAPPPVDEWLEDLDQLAQAAPEVPGAEAVREARAEDDAELARAARS